MKSWEQDVTQGPHDLTILRKKKVWFSQYGLHWFENYGVDFEGRYHVMWYLRILSFRTKQKTSQLTMQGIQ